MSYVKGGPHYHPHNRRFLWHRRGRRWQKLDQSAQAAPDPQVQTAQQCLAQSDPSVPQDGIMGPRTKHAIRAFQKQHQLPPTGMLDGATMSALQATCGGQSADQPDPQSGQQSGPPGPRPPGPQHEAEEGEFRFGGLFSRPLFDRRRAEGFDRFRDDRFRVDRFGERRVQWPSQEAESGEYGESEIRVERPVFRTGFVRPPVEVRTVERFGPVGGRWNWDRDRRRFPWRWEGRAWGVDAAADRSQILSAQSCLAQVLGAWVLQDGVMGSNTLRAIRAFQEQRQLPVTGVLDGATADALQAACGS